MSTYEAKFIDFPSFQPENLTISSQKPSWTTQFTEGDDRCLIFTMSYTDNYAQFLNTLGGYIFLFIDGQPVYNIYDTRTIWFPKTDYLYNNNVFHVSVDADNQMTVEFIVTQNPSYGTPYFAFSTYGLYTDTEFLFRDASVKKKIKVKYVDRNYEFSILGENFDLHQSFASNPIGFGEGCASTISFSAICPEYDYIPIDSQIDVYVEFPDLEVDDYFVKSFYVEETTKNDAGILVVNAVDAFSKFMNLDLTDYYYDNYYGTSGKYTGSQIIEGLISSVSSIVTVSYVHSANRFGTARINVTKKPNTILLKDVLKVLSLMIGTVPVLTADNTISILASNGAKSKYYATHKMNTNTFNGEKVRYYKCKIVNATSSVMSSYNPPSGKEYVTDTLDVSNFIVLGDMDLSTLSGKIKVTDINTVVNSMTTGQHGQMSMTVMADLTLEMGAKTNFCPMIQNRSMHGVTFLTDTLSCNIPVDLGVKVTSAASTSAVSTLAKSQVLKIDDDGKVVESAVGGNDGTSILLKDGLETTSDARLKTDVETLDDIKNREMLMALRPVSYYLVKSDHPDNPRLHKGLIAQEVHDTIDPDENWAVYCEVPSYAFDGETMSYKPTGEFTCGLRYDELIPCLLKEIQCLRQEIDKLKEN